MRAILTYHAVEPAPSATSIDEAAFRRHVAWLAAGAVRVCTLPELLVLPPDSNAVALTFDDGFASFAERAWPLLRERGLPVTVFVVSDHVGGTNAWADRSSPRIPTRPLMDWDTLGRLAEAGVALGSHTRRHRDLRGASAAELDDELGGSAERIAKETGHRPSSFAYPYGLLDAAVVATAARAYASACTTRFAPLTPRDDPHRLPRLDVYYFRAAGRLQQWGSSEFYRYVRLVAAARAVRRLFKGHGA